MSFLTYVKTLLPSFSKNKIVASCEMTQTSIREHTLPAYQAAETLLKGAKFKSEVVRDFAKIYARDVDKSAGGMIGSIRTRLDNSLVILNYIALNAKNIFSEVEASIALTYTKATYMRLVESAEFANTYARKFLNYVYILETAEADENASVKDSLTPAEIDWVNKNFIDFCLCLNIVGNSIAQIEKQMKELPDASITELSEKTFPTTLGVGKIDPFQIRHLSAAVNPFYYFGMHRAESQAKRYKAAKEELELLQLRKLNLEQINAKKPDAKVQKEIQYMENRVAGLNYDVTKMEKEYLDA